jgi:hypothetical protein
VFLLPFHGRSEWMDVISRLQLMPFPFASTQDQTDMILGYNLAFRKPCLMQFQLSIFHLISESSADYTPDITVQSCPVLSSRKTFTPLYESSTIHTQVIHPDHLCVEHQTSARLDFRSFQLSELSQETGSQPASLSTTPHHPTHQNTSSWSR